MRQLPAAVTVDGRRLTDALDCVADVAAAIERHADGRGPLDDSDGLIATLRGVIAGFAFDLDAATYFP